LFRKTVSGILLTLLLTSMLTLAFNIQPAKAIPTPTLYSPANGSTVSTRKPNFDWSDVTGATYYEIIVDNNPDWSSPEIRIWNLDSRAYINGAWAPWASTWTFTVKTTSAPTTGVEVDVKPGQWAKYTPSTYSGYSSVTISISSVSGTTIYGTKKIEFPDGSTQTLSFQYDVSKEPSLNWLDYLYFIPANSKVGDKIGSSIFALTIEGVDTRSYAGASRTVLYATYWTAKYYWDQRTGILVEETDIASSLKLTETNIWGGGIFDASASLFWVLVIVIIVAVAAVILIVLLSLRKKRLPHKVATPLSQLEKSVETKYCPKCGARMPVDAYYCPKCAHKQPET
jgi:hypothetical protein